MNKGKLTFGIPMYNSEKYIKDLLKCFPKKSKKIEFEIIIVDDGSTDRSFEICTNYDNPYIKVIRKKNSGVSSTRNCIIKNATGEWITFIDSDDIINFEEYEKAFLYLKDKPIEWLINLEKKRLNIDVNFLIENEVINSPCMKFYNLNIILNNDIKFDKKYDLGEDLLFNLDYLHCVNNIGYFFGKIYVYRKNSFSLTRKYREDKFEILMKVYNECINKCKDDKYLYSFEYIRIKNCISSLKDEIIKKGKSFKEYLEYIKYMKNYKTKTKNIKFTSIFKNIIYYLWYMIPNTAILIFFKYYFIFRDSIRSTFF